MLLSGKPSNTGTIQLSMPNLQHMSMNSQNIFFSLCSGYYSSIIYCKGPKFTHLSLVHKGIILGLLSCNKLSPSNSHYSQMELKELPKNQNNSNDRPLFLTNILDKREISFFIQVGLMKYCQKTALLGIWDVLSIWLFTYFTAREKKYQKSFLCHFYMSIACHLLTWQSDGK